MLFEPLTKEQEKAIFDEIGYDKQKLSKDIESIRKWLAYQHHLPPSRNNEPDAFIKNFLMGCKGSLERCKQKLDCYYSFRSECAQLFENRDPEKVIENSQFQLAGFFPNANAKGQKSYFIWNANEDVIYYDCIGSIQKTLNLLDVQLRMEGLNGGVYLLSDGKNFTAAHVLRMNPTGLRNLMTYVQDALPYRIKGIFFLNTPSYLEMAINRLIKPFFKSKLLKRSHFLPEGYDDLNKFYDKKHLPNDMGGEAPSRAEINEKWEKRVLAEKNWFDNAALEKTDESKRSKEATSNPYLGIQGSIRQLSID